MTQTAIEAAEAKPQLLGREVAERVLGFGLLALLCVNVFAAFFCRNLKLAVRCAASLLQIARQVAAELQNAIPSGPARTPT